jgi:uncharacterized repeat protein (TIGR03803 family)
MKSMGFGRYALCSCVAAAMLTACGALAPSPQLSRADRIGHHFPTTSSFQVLHEFGSELKIKRPWHRGTNPVAGLLDVDGTLYGTTFYGGQQNSGVVYSIGTTGAYKVLYRFDASKKYQAENPNSDLINVNGTLYGTTSGLYGTIYSVTTAGIEKVLHANNPSHDPGTPAYLVNLKGNLYGTSGGNQFAPDGELLHVNSATYGGGIVYKITPSGVYKVIYTFRGSGNGSGPSGALLNVNGTLYGVTVVGGTGCSGCGTVFSVTPSGKEKVLYSFQGGSDGQGPTSGLIDVNGTLYGTTKWGGGSGCQSGSQSGCGTVYSITTSGSEKVLYRFSGGADGRYPNASLTEMNGTLYGTTQGGGSAGDGTVFSISPSGGEQVVHSFVGSDGAYVNADLIAVKNVLYGTTSSGGVKSGCAGKGCGTVFALTP